LILANELKKRYDIHFIINNNKSAIKLLDDKKITHSIIPEHISIKRTCREINQTMKSESNNLLILDFREYAERISRILRNENYKIMIIDDAWIQYLYANFLINGTPVKQYHNYKIVNNSAKIFLGTKYFIMSEEFLKHKKRVSEIREKKQYRIVISIGGSDTHNLTLLILKSLLDLDYLQIIVIVGPFSHNQTKLEKLIKNNKHIIVLRSPKSIWKEFNKADLVISSAGSTLFELAVQRVPTLCISDSKHQIPYARVFSSQGFSINLGYYHNVNSRTISNSVVRILNDVRKRRRMVLTGNKIIDGRGLSNIVVIIDKILSR